MTEMTISDRVQAIAAYIAPLIQFQTASGYQRAAGDPESCDFAFGNPHDPVLPAVVAALKKWIEPRNKDWFAYKFSEPTGRAAVAAGLSDRFGAAYDAEDIMLTNGAFGAIAATIAAVTNPGDEVIYMTPPWFFYAPIIVAFSARPVAVPVDPGTYDLDLAAIEAAITPTTAAVIVNSPNNPTGRIYPPETLAGLADLLEAASQRSGRRIYLLSDEAYARIVYDGRTFPSPTRYYPHSFQLYTYGKTLLTPGQRMGYIALPPEMPGRELMRMALLGAQAVTGYAFPNALMQYALPELEHASVDVGRLQRRRDRLVKALREAGYEVNSPEGTFYLLVRSPWSDDAAFCDLLAREKIYCLPGSVFEMPGYFRISVTANDTMVERALPEFARAIAAARQRATVTA
jgi:aspartate aminotransferase